MALHNYIVDNQLDIMFITETWLTTDPADKILLDRQYPLGLQVILCHEQQAEVEVLL